MRLNISDLAEICAACVVVGLVARQGLDWLAAQWVDYTDRRKD